LRTTINIEFTSESEEHLQILEEQLRQIHDVKVDLVEPPVHTVPALLVIGIEKRGERAERASQAVAQVLHDFLHEDDDTQSQKKIFLVTIEGDRTDIEDLSVEQIERIIFEAEEEES
jgi:effector-binding domain-containing protein